MFLNAFKDATRKDGSILSVVSYAHSGAVGLFFDDDAGFYSSDYTNFTPTSDNTPITNTYSNVDLMSKAVQSGQIKFEKNATWLFASCQTANSKAFNLRYPNQNIAEYTAKKLNITTIGATGPVSPQYNSSGGETGLLVTDGTFIKYEPYQVSKQVTTYQTFLGFRVPFTTKTTTVTETKVKATDLGRTIDPKQITGN